jgi:hypothetical protein
LIKSFRDIKNVHHWKTGDQFQLESSEIYQKIFFKSKQGILEKENCMHLQQPGIYLAANGKVSHCCYFASDDYKSFDNIEQMLYNINIEDTLNNPDKKCLVCCGT